MKSVSHDPKTVPNTGNYRDPELKLFIRDVRDASHKKRPVMVRSWATISDLKHAIQQLIHVPPSAQRLYYGPLLTSGHELPNYRRLQDAGLYRSGETLLLDIKRNNNDSSSNHESTTTSAFTSLTALRPSSVNDVCLSSSMADATPRALRTLVQQARRGFALGLRPDFIMDGSGGSYILHDARKNQIAVFKPADEEPYAVNNPRGYLPQAGQQLSLRDGVKPGEACIREVAAYLLDHDGLASVPMTTLAEARHPTFNYNGSRLNVLEGGASIGSHSISPKCAFDASKKAGSLQEFVRAECTMDDISPSLLSVEEVHKIALLDIRILNADRNAANLLCRRRPDDSLELVPIDHGYCLRSKCDVSWMDWCWLDWPQLKQPISEEHKKYILNLDVEGDASMLQERLGLCQEALDYFRLSSAFLKAGVKAGLTLYDIAVMCCRNDNLGEVPSKLEMLANMASELAVIAMENERYDHNAASRALVLQLSPKPMSRDRSLAARFRRSQSSGEFLTYPVDASDSDSPGSLGEALARQGVAGSPPMAHSSGSDSSSADVADDSPHDEDGKEDCEVWAATVIADMRNDTVFPVPPSRRFRRSSDASDESSGDSGLSTSPKGFWTTRPGASPASISDDGSVQWEQSPLLTPRRFASAAGARPMSPLDMMATTPAATEDTSNPKLVKPSVKFALDTMCPFIPPNTVNVSQLKPDVSTSAISSEPTGGGMTRSKSYSALSRASSSFTNSQSSSKSSATDDNRAAQVAAPPPPPPYATKEYAFYRTYFLKFVDLVVAREVTTAAAHANAAMTK